MKLQDLVKMAYTLDDPLLNDGGLFDTQQIRGGPAWTRSNFYTIEAVTDNPVANGPADRLGTPGSKIMRGPMLRALLEDRFQVRVHRDVEEVPIYALTVAKAGLKLKALEEGGCTRIDREHPPSLAEFEGHTPFCNTNNGGTNGQNRTVRTVGSFSWFASTLSRILDRHVIDKTGIPGTFDIHLEYAPDENTPGKAAPRVDDQSSNGPTAPSIFTALEQQLGLKLVPDKGQHGYIVIDRAEQPSAN